MSGMDVRDERNAQICCAFHATAQKCGHLLLLLNGRFDDEFVMYLLESGVRKAASFAIVVNGIHMAILMISAAARTKGVFIAARSPN